MVSLAPDIKDNLAKPKRNHRPVIVGQNDEYLNDDTGRLSLHATDSSAYPPTVSSSLQTLSYDHSPSLISPSTCRPFGIPSPAVCFTSGHAGNIGAMPGFYGHSSLELAPLPLPRNACNLRETSAVVGQPRASMYTTFHQRGSPKAVGRRDNDYPPSHHNVVDIGRIQQGLDVRTTVGLHAIT